MGNQLKTDPKSLKNQQKLLTPTNSSAQIQIEIFKDEKIVRNENLHQVQTQKMGLRLHKFIGVLIMKYRPTNKIGYGTGILISQNLVLACAHNLYCHDLMIDPPEILFYPGQSGVLNRSYKVEKYWFPQAFKDKNTITNDYALLKLEKEVDLESLPQPSDDSVKDNRFIKLRDTFNQQCLGQQIAIFGYTSSSYKQTDDRNNIESVYQSGLIRRNRIVKINTEIGAIEHDISTEGGQSGSPLISINNYGGRQILHIIGIHKGSAQKKRRANVKGSANGQMNVSLQDQQNVARLIVPSLIKQLQEQALKWNAKMFSILQTPYVNFKKSSEPRLQVTVKYSEIRQLSCLDMAKLYLKFSDQQVLKSTYFYANKQLFFPESKFALNPQLEALMSYYDESEPLQVLVLGQNDLFYHEMKSISQIPQLQHKAKIQFERYLNQRDKHRVDLLSRKASIDYFKQKRNIMPLYSFTLALIHGKYPNFLKQLRVPISRQLNENQIYVPMTALLLKHAKKLPIFQGTSYNLMNYTNIDWKVNQQVTIKHFMSCLTKRQLAPTVVSRVQGHLLLLEIQSLSSRVFYEVSSTPSYNQVIFLPFTVFMVQSKRQDIICNNKKVKVISLKEINTLQQNLTNQ